jgi:hypothetical protein
MTKPAAQRISVFLLSAVWLTAAGCVTRHAYEKARAEADELARTLAIARTDVSELDRRIADLQAANRREDAATTALRAAIQREQDQLPILRQRADAQLASLQAQVAHLINQSRALTRQIADAKRESVSLRALTEQYKQELEEPSPLLVPTASETGEPVAPTPSSSTASPGSPVNPAVPLQQTARIAPVAAPQPSIPPPPAQINPGPVDHSWTGMIMSWLSSLWSLLFG